MIAAVIPAAGSSSRMGRPKLLLRFDGQSLIGHVVSTLRRGGARRVVVVAPPNDAPEGPDVAAEARLAGAEVVVPLERPSSMRASIELGIESLARQETPQSLLLTPGDSPGVSADLVAQLVASAAQMPEHILIPSHDGRRGHPIVLPWRIARQIPTLPPDSGVNALVSQHGSSVVELMIPRPEILADLDTQEDLERWLQRPEAREWVAARAATCTADFQEHASESEFPSSNMSASLAESHFRVRVRLFALAKDRAGQSELELSLVRGSTVRDLRIALGETAPALAPLLSSALFAVDEEYASDDTPISPGSRLAVIPPVSGGAGGYSQAQPAGISRQMMIDND